MNRRFPPFFKPPPDQAAKGDDAEGACDRAITSVSVKADRNERLSRPVTIVIIASSALIPVLVIAGTAGHPFLWGKLVPSVLAAFSAAAAGPPRTRATSARSRSSPGSNVIGATCGEPMDGVVRWLVRGGCWAARAAIGTPGERARHAA